MSSREPNARSFCVLHDSDTDMGTLMLRRRWSPALECDVFEMTLDGKLMMSSAASVSEQALAERALELLPEGPLRVLVGGLGFGFTALAALADARVRELKVVERLATVVAWHRSGLLPWSEKLTADPRVEIVEGDFFAAVAGRAEPDARYDAILIDIDDSPSLLWHDGHAGFYEARSLKTCTGICSRRASSAYGVPPTRAPRSSQPPLPSSPQPYWCPCLSRTRACASRLPTTCCWQQPTRNPAPPSHDAGATRQRGGKTRQRKEMEDRGLEPLTF